MGGVIGSTGSTKMLSFGILYLASLLFSCSAQSLGELRLWSQPSSATTSSNSGIVSGRLQIYISGQWGEVCDDGFGELEAEVACHQLQFLTAANNGVGSGDGIETDLLPIRLSDVYCPTSDYLHLLRCSFQLGQHSCTGKGYTMLQCNSTYIWETPYLGQLRVMNGDYPSQGLVQIYCGGEWGTICTNYPFREDEADTVCRQLGYTSADKYNHLYGYGSVLLSNVDCPTSDEHCLGACRLCSQRVESSCYTDRLTVQCKFDTLHFTFGSNVSTCAQSESIYARPRVGEVRTTPSGPVGVAELYHNVSGELMWKGVCVSENEDNNLRVAHTFCTQLGYSSASSSYTSSDYHGNTSISISCPVQYSHLLSCTVSSVASCSSYLNVTCSAKNDPYTGQVRLVGGDYPSEGRVEIYVYDKWSTIYYSDGYYGDDDTAKSVCLQLGYTDVAYYTQGELSGSGGSVHVINPDCYSDLPCFSNCLRSWDFYDGKSDYVYIHDFDLSVNCSFDTRLISQSTFGSKSLCEIEVPSSYHISGGAIAGIVVSCLLCVTLSLGAIIITIIVCCTKKNSRRVRQNQYTSGPVGYNPQAQGGGAVYMVPVSGIPPEGVLLVPPQTQTQNEDEEEKVPPPYSDEVTPDS